MKLSQITEAQKMHPVVRSNFSKLIKILSKIDKRLGTLEAGSKESGKSGNSPANDAMARIYARDRAMDKVDTGSRNVYYKPEGHWG